MPSHLTTTHRVLASEQGKFVVLFEQEVGGRKFLALIPEDRAQAFLEGEGAPGEGPMVMEEREQMLVPISEADRIQFIRATYEQVKDLYEEGASL